MRFCFLVALLALAVTAMSAQAQENPVGIRIGVDPGDTPLSIVGWLDDQETFIGNLRLTAQGGDVPTFVFLASDLKTNNAEYVIGRNKVTLIGDSKLVAEVPKDFQVSVGNLKYPGVYTGTITILLPGQPPDKGLTVPVKVDARARPDVAPLPGSERVRLHLVRCHLGLDCGLARLLLPSSAFVDRWYLQLDNRTQSTARISSVEAALTGEQTGYRLTGADLGLPQASQILPARQIGAVLMTFQRLSLPSDRFAGTIYLTLDGRSDRLGIPVNVDVRSGPFWALVLLFVGIVLGRLVKYMQDRGEAQARALADVYRIEARLDAMDADDQAILMPLVMELRQAVYAHKLADLPSETKIVEARLLALAELRMIEMQLMASAQPPPDDLLSKIVHIRQYVSLKEDSEAQQLLGELKKALGERAPRLMGPDEPRGRAYARAEKTAEKAEQALRHAAQSKPSAPDRRSWSRRLLIKLTGLSDQVRAETTLWLVKPLLYLVLLFLLLALGMESIYVNNGMAFGATPLADYLGLVMWGLSADVVSRNLTNLRGNTKA